MLNQVKLNGKRAIVTGGAGFIGSHVANELIKLGCDVIVFDDLSGGFKSNFMKECIFIKGSITNTALIKRIFNQYPINYVYHIAAYAAEGLSHFIRKFNYNNNLIGSINFINAAINSEIECFVFTSSIAVYGTGKVPMREEDNPLPEDPYGISKLAVELDLRSAHDIFGLNYIIFRPHNVYGPHQNTGDKYRNVVGIFMNQLMNGRELTIFGDGQQTRAFSCIDDVSPTIAACVGMPDCFNNIFNIGSDTPVSVNDLANEVCQAMGNKGRIKYLNDRKEVKHAYSSHEKIKKYFGVEPKVSLPEGLKVMADWVKKVGNRKSKRFKNIEIGKNMPASWASEVVPVDKTYKI
jgi:UDP-glucose 4-epimerase